MRSLCAAARLLAVLAGFLTLVAPAAASADPLVVDQDSIGGTCSDARTPAQVSLTTPWCTIARAVTVAPSGATVYLRAGSYPYQQLHGLGTRTDYVTLEPYGYGGSAPESVTIAGISTANTSFLRFEGLHLVGADSSGFVPAARIYIGSQYIELIDDELTGEGVYVQSADHLTFKGNYIHNLVRNCAVTQIGDGGGIFLQRASDVQVLDNRIVDSLQDALNVGSIPNLWVQGNDMSTAPAQCGDHTDLMQIEGGAQGPVTVIDNVFHDGGQFILRNATGLTIENNTGCGSLIIRDYAPGSNFTLPPFNYTNQMTGTVVENNIMRMFANSAVPDAEYHDDYNLIYGAPSNSTGVRGAHTLFASPAFVDATNGDYHLLSGSPGLDAADQAVAPPTDMLGYGPSDDPDTADAGVGALGYRDMGALESQFGPTAPPTGGGDPPPG
jgi:parallel beta helix pectate lyase-like protein